MDRSSTQFWVAVVSVTFVGAIVGMLVWGAIFREVDMGTAMASFAGLTGISGAASTWLFRTINGAAKQEAEG